ncbi:MAG: hypothetical protein IKM97_03905 [Clostridia bacterium]|nr:hypothetical protein [Clostridia bacterium]
MSKLLKIYNELKKKDSKKIYLFENGIFYYMLNEDATIVSNKIRPKNYKFRYRNNKMWFSKIDTRKIHKFI